MGACMVYNRLMITAFYIIGAVAIGYPLILILNPF